MNTNYMEDNVITPNLSYAGEKVINQDHLYNIIHSKVMDCNPHTRVKYRTESVSKQIGDDYVIFVPSSATQPIKIPNSKRIIIDIRSLTIRGKTVLDVLGPLISDFKVKAKSALGKTGTIYLTPTSVSDVYHAERPDPPLKGKHVTILIDRYTLNDLDEYCTMVLAYFYKHYHVKGTPHAMHNYIFREIRIGEKKHVIAIPVLKLES